MAIDVTRRMELPSTDVQGVELVVIDGPDRGARIAAQVQTRIGAAAGCHLRLTDPTVSRVHCEVQLGARGLRVVDAGSTNGTFVDGVSIRDADVGPGATLRVGATTLRVESTDEVVHLPSSDRESLGDLVGGSAPMRQVYAIIERVGPTESTVLIGGDTGTGKELAAREIHRASRRRDGPFLPVDCGAIAPNVIESELFGHVRGAFSGAVSDRRGLFEEADGGTIFLDEIGELPQTLQAKLLRALESREVRRVGANVARKVNVRVLAATNRPLARSINDESFREELYYRLAVVELRLPPLRGRREDIPALVAHFHHVFTERKDPPPPELLSVALTRGWPGNVRELRNFVERCVSLGVHSPSATPSARPPLAGVGALVPVHLPLKEARIAWMDAFESAYLRVLERHAGHVTRAAEAAGVNRRLLQRMMLRIGMRPSAGIDEEPPDLAEPHGDDS